MPESRGSERSKSTREQLIDAHVHLIGDGSSGSGCWQKPSIVRWPLAIFMARHIGLSWAALRRGLDQAYVDCVLRQVRSSSLDAVVLLAQENVYSEDGKRWKGAGAFHVPNAYVLELSRRHLEFLPAVSIHPARADALEELDRCLEAGAALMKILPNCQNIDCSLPKYTRFWERMAEAGLPLLAHTGGEHTLPVVRRDLANPRTLERPLQCGVTVIAAHCGTKSGLFDPQYFSVFEQMTRQYPNLYGDTSAFNVPIRGRVIPDCLRPPLVDRMVHGSDFPVPVFGLWAWMNGYIDRQTFWKWDRHPSVLERDYQLKKAMGFPEMTFARANQLLRIQPLRSAVGHRPDRAFISGE